MHRQQMTQLRGTGRRGEGVARGGRGLARTAACDANTAAAANVAAPSPQPLCLGHRCVHYRAEQ